MKKYFVLLALAMVACAGYSGAELKSVKIVSGKPANCEMVGKIDTTYSVHTGGGADSHDAAVKMLRARALGMDADTVRVEREEQTCRSDSGRKITGGDIETQRLACKNNDPVWGHIAYAYKCKK